MLFAISFALVSGLAAAATSGDEYEARIVVSGLKDGLTESDATQVGLHAKSSYLTIFGPSHFGAKHDEIQYVKTTAATTIPASSFYSGSSKDEAICAWFDGKLLQQSSRKPFGGSPRQV